MLERDIWRQFMHKQTLKSLEAYFNDNGKVTRDKHEQDELLIVGGDKKYARIGGGIFSTVPQLNAAYTGNFQKHLSIRVEHARNKKQNTWRQVPNSVIVIEVRYYQ